MSLQEQRRLDAFEEQLCRAVRVQIKKCLPVLRHPRYFAGSGSWRSHEDERTRDRMHLWDCSFCWNGAWRAHHRACGSAAGRCGTSRASAPSRVGVGGRILSMEWSPLSVDSRALGPASASGSRMGSRTLGSGSWRVGLDQRPLGVTSPGLNRVSVDQEWAIVRLLRIGMAAHHPWEPERANGRWPLQAASERCAAGSRTEAALRSTAPSQRREENCRLESFAHPLPYSRGPSVPG